MKTPTINDIDERLESMAASVTIDPDCREAARWAASIIRTVRQEYGMLWSTSAEQTLVTLQSEFPLSVRQR